MQHFLLSGLAKSVSLKVVSATRIFRTLLLASGLLLVFSTHANAQESEPLDVILVENAPHLPMIIRAESSDNQVYQGERFKYNLEKNNESFQNWIDDYPAEFDAYKKAMDQFFIDNKPEDFTGFDQDFFYDMKAQYQMLKKLQSW